MFGAKNSPNSIYSIVNIVICNRVIIVRPLRHFLAGVQQALGNLVLTVSAPVPQAALQLFERRWLEKNKHSVRRLFLNDQSALHFNFQDDINALSAAFSHPGARRSVVIVGVLRVFQQLIVGHHFVEAGRADKVVVHAVDFQTLTAFFRPGGAGGSGDALLNRPRQIGPCQKRIQHGVFADGGGAGDYKEQSAPVRFFLAHAGRRL